MRDFARARDDLGAFAKLAGCPLAKFQLAALGLESRVTYLLGPRQSGKSRSVAALGAWWAFRQSNQHVLIISAGEMGSKRLLAMIADLVTASPLLSASVVDEQSNLIRLSNGSTIRSLPASSKAIRGWSVDLLVIDEAVEIDDSIIDAAMPTTAARPDARIVFSSTGGAPVGRSYETYMAGLDSRSTTVRSFRWRLKDAKWIAKASVEHERNTLPPWKFAAEYDVRDSKTDAGAGRRVYLPGGLVDELSEWRARSPMTADYDPVFVCRARHGRHGRQTTDNVGRRLKSAIEVANERLAKLGIEPVSERVSPHSLRRTYASLRCVLGDQLIDIAEQIGHSDPRFTMSVYAKAAKRRERLSGEYLAAFDRALDWATMGSIEAIPDASSTDERDQRARVVAE